MKDGQISGRENRCAVLGYVDYCIHSIQQFDFKVDGEYFHDHGKAMTFGILQPVMEHYDDMKS